MGYVMKTALLLLVSLQCAALPISNGWVEGEGDVGTERSIGRIAALLPFYETGDSTSFVYLRGLWDSQDAREGNVGLGYRQLCGNAVLGGYLFYDGRRSASHKTYQQLSVGVEGYTSCFEARLNGYISFDGERELQNTGWSEAFIREDQVRLLCQPNDHERALPGLDGEIGYRYCCGCVEAKLFVGGYWFDKERYHTVAGAKGRAELSLNNLPYGAKLTAGIEGYGDDLRSGKFGGIVRLQVPFGGCSRPCDLCSRLYERIERLDMVTRTRRSPLCESEALFKGREITEIVYAQTDLVGEVTTAANGALIIVNGQFDVDATVAMKDEQILAGGGAELLMTGDCPCGSGILTVPGPAGSVVDVGSADPVIGLAENGTVAGLTIEAIGDHDAVEAGGVAGVMVMDNTISTIDGRGVSLSSSDNGTVTGNDIATEGGSAHGVLLNNSNNGTVTGNNIATEGGAAYGVYLLSSSDDGTVTGNDIATEGSLAVGVFLNNSVNGTVTGNDIATEGDDAYGVYLLNNSDDGTVTGNDIATEGGSAYGVYLFNSSNGTVTGNSIATEGSLAVGVSLSSSNNGTVTGNNIATEGDDAHGVFLDSSEDAEVVSNEIDTTGDDADGIRLKGVNSYILSDNDISVSGSGSEEIKSVP
jgi:Periplasmic copper-binding protein (NosD)/Inverse autotransporter, beta-domain